MRALLVLVVLAGVLMPRSAAACDCMPPPPADEALREAEVVVIAKVTRVDEEIVSGSNWVGTGPRHYTLQIERAWKGANAGDVITIDRDPGGSTCEYDLAENTTHLLYLTRHAGRLDASAPHCTRNQPLAQAAAEIAALDRLAPPAVPATTKGSRGCGGCTTRDGDASGLLGLGLVLALAASRSVRRGTARQG